MRKYSSPAALPQSIVLTKIVATPCGRLMIGSVAGRLCLCTWFDTLSHQKAVDRIRHCLKCDFSDGHSEVLHRAESMLKEYFARSRRDLSIPLLLCGTHFQRKVWRGIKSVGYGTTLSYGLLAARLHSNAAVRAVAAAAGANPVSLFVPCHRIVGSGGQLTGYAGSLTAKSTLLDLETTGLFP